MTPRQLALAELKTAKRMKNRAMTIEDFIKNDLLPRLNATKKKIICHKGKVSDVCEFPDNTRRLQANITTAWMLGLFPP